MKKILFVLTVVVIVSSCSKRVCWQLVDCIGNDIAQYCGSEKEVQDYCASISSPGCAITYRR